MPGSTGGTIYGKVKALTGYGLGRIEGWPDREIAHNLANDTVATAAVDLITAVPSPAGS